MERGRVDVPEQSRQRTFVRVRRGCGSQVNNPGTAETDGAGGGGYEFVAARVASSLRTRR